jgi:hypothetical protein
MHAPQVPYNPLDLTEEGGLWGSGAARPISTSARDPVCAYVYMYAYAWVYVCSSLSLLREIPKVNNLLLFLFFIFNFVTSAFCN